MDVAETRRANLLGLLAEKKAEFRTIEELAEHYDLSANYDEMAKMADAAKAAGVETQFRAMTADFNACQENGARVRARARPQ